MNVTVCCIISSIFLAASILSDEPKWGIAAGLFAIAASI